MANDIIPLGSDQLPKSSGLETAAMMDAETDPILVDGTDVHERNAAERVPSGGPQDYPTPPALLSGEEFVWDEDQPTAERYQALGRRLAKAGDLYRCSRYASGLLLAFPQSNIAPRLIETAQRANSLIVDRVRIRVEKRGSTKSRSIAAAHLYPMLGTESFLQAFRPVDEVVRVATYLPSFKLSQPGYNDGGPGHRYLYAGPCAA